MTLYTRSHFALATLFLGLVALPARGADDGVVLEWKFKPGQTSHYTTSVDIRAQQKVGNGQAEEFNSKQTSDMTWVVESVDDDGSAHIRQTIERVRVASSAGDKDQTFDSKEDKVPEGVDEAAIEPLRLMVNQPVYLTIDARGKVTDVRPSDELTQKLKQSPQRGPLAAMFSREGLKQTASSNTLEFPADPVSRGTTWQQQATMSDPASGRQTLVTTYRYEGSEERDGQALEKISATAKILPPGNQAAAQRVNIKDQKSNGVVWFDRGVGRIHEMETTTKIVREVNFGVNKLEETVTTKIHMQLVSESEGG